MYCKTCGKQIVDDSLFCSYCGKPTTETSIVDENNYETCQISANWVKARTNLLGQFDYECYFWADAMSPKGSYSAGTSSKYYVRGVRTNADLFNPPNPPTGNNKEDQTKSSMAHHELIDKLLKEGWQSTDRGSAWWEYRFRRKIKQSN